MAQSYEQQASASSRWLQAIKVFIVYSVDTEWHGSITSAHTQK